jgi:hypothetical protein
MVHQLLVTTVVSYTSGVGVARSVDTAVLVFEHYDAMKSAVEKLRANPVSRDLDVVRIVEELLDGTAIF